ncbi:MAG: flavodoxin family protein [Coriobacteriia bacterium]|nr:flavodoxin family protein [Coriobacteriia bacterium]
MDRLIICGSPRANGRSAKMAKDLFEACIAEAPEDELALVSVSQVSIAGCKGCGLCERLAEGPYDDEDGFDLHLEDGVRTVSFTARNSAGDEVPRRCFIDDDMNDVYELLDHADELYIVSPVYFAGAPAQLKALLDRLQPYFMATRAQREQAAAEGRPFATAVRPAILHVVGDGGDPHGIDALVTSVKSAVACAGFKLETVFDWVGQVTEEGDIVGDPLIMDMLTGTAVVPGQDQQDESEPEDEGPTEWADLPEEPVDEVYEEEDDYDFVPYDEEPAARPVLHFHDEQVEERGRKSAEAGKRGHTRGRGEKRATKGGNQTNNRNPRKENQSKKRRSDSGKKNTGRPVSQGRSGARANGGKGQGAAGAKGGAAKGGKGGKKRG